MTHYTYNQSKNIRTNQSVERFGQCTPDGNDMCIAYISDVEYKKAVSGEWVSDGHRWCIAEPHLTNVELIEWLINNGLTRLPFSPT